MMIQEPEACPPAAKRRKLNALPSNDAATTEQTNVQKGLNRPISPPLSRRKSPTVASALFTPTWGFDHVPKQTPIPVLPPVPTSRVDNEPELDGDGADKTRFIPSPVQLTKIEDLGPHQNVDAVGLKDILGDPLIKECWNFNFLFDLDFVMQQFDSDVREMVKVKIVHGFWKRDDERRIALLETAERYPNIELLSAYIPDPFGTHHSKMLILFRHDDTAQVVIHTANMIYRDWSNMTQAVWKSPRLPLLSQSSISSSPAGYTDAATHAIGSGERFRVDLLRYLGAYEKRLIGLTRQLGNYDFSTIRAAFIGSVPSRQKPDAAKPSSHTSFGWLGLQEILSSIPIPRLQTSDVASHIVIQISSIATLGPTPAWLTHFQSILARYASGQISSATEPSSSFTKASTFFSKCESTLSPRPQKASSVKFNVIFPTPEEIRTSLDGYNSGGSIHWKLQSTQQQKQLDYLHPLLCHWKATPTPESRKAKGRKAHREPAAPHIKTYIRFSNEEHKTIDWAMVTSANLSKQAWGDVVNKKDETWIQSWETGVVVWPALFATSNSQENTGDLVIVPVFGKDTPEAKDIQEDQEGEDTVIQEQVKRGPKTVVGFRMPYDLPLSPYGVDDKPWCATMKYQEPDWKNQRWNGY